MDRARWRALLLEQVVARIERELPEDLRETWTNTAEEMAEELEEALEGDRPEASLDILEHHQLWFEEFKVPESVNAEIVGWGYKHRAGKAGKNETVVVGEGTAPAEAVADAIEKLEAEGWEVVKIRERCEAELERSGDHESHREYLVNSGQLGPLDPVPEEEAARFRVEVRVK